MEIFDKLKAPFPPEKISWRVGASNKKAWEKDNSIQKKGIALAYIDARDVMERLDEVVSPAHWQALYPHANGKTSCKIGVYCPPRPDLGGGYEWVWKENGAGDSDVEAEKGAFSDAFKRAAVLWGIGRYLYDLGNVWVELDDRWQIKDTEKKNKLFPALVQLSKGVLPKPPEDKFTPENKSLQAEVITKIALCKDEVDISSLLDEYADRIEELPEELSGDISGQIDNRRKQIKDGVTPQITGHKFAGVDDAIKWMTKMAPVVKGFKSIKVLDEWENYNRPWLNGLECLSAKKYLKDGKTPRERMLQALMDKRCELENINTANTPIG